MEFFRLNDSFYPSDTLKNFDSLVWTERYQQPGDFQLVVKDEISVLSQFPLGCLISHTDTHEIMIVENHEFFREKKNLKITLSGRSFETFAENRVTSGSQYSIQDPITGEKNVEIEFANSSSVHAYGLLAETLEDGFALEEDAIPNLSVDFDMRVFDDEMIYSIKRGDIYSRVIELLRICDAGIKNVRPNAEFSNPHMLIHDGVDRTNSVIFYALYEDLDDAKYFWSIKNYKNYAQVSGVIDARLYRHRDILTDLTGLNRRVIYEEADDLLDDYSPGSPDDPISARGQAVLDEHKKVSLIQAKISATARPKFKIDYDVGDLVTVFGEFGTVQIMRVTEHVLTVDSKGMRGYPSLTIL